jgi:hypothetical protein
LVPVPFPVFLVLDWPFPSAFFPLTPYKPLMSQHRHHRHISLWDQVPPRGEKDCVLHFHRTPPLVRSLVGDVMFLWNVGIDVWNYTAP